MATTTFRASMLACAARYWLPMRRAAARPAVAQARTLGRILQVNRRSHFGTAHGFDHIRTPRDFQQRVPIHDYEALRPHIDAQRMTGTPALTAQRPVFYAQTSGSTGAPKYIPVTPLALRLHRDEQALFTYLQYRYCPAAFSGRALGVMGASVEGHLDSGQPVGSVSGHLYESLPAALRSRFVIPPSVFSIADYDLKYLVILRLALADPAISYLGSPNPSTFLRLLALLQQEREMLTRSLDTGTLPVLAGFPASVRTRIDPLISPEPAQAARLRAAGRELTFAALWPRIALVTTWMGGSCGVALDRLRAVLPRDTRVMELGYQSTECRGTLPLDGETAAGLPALQHTFFEFADPASWDQGGRATLTLEQLESGRRYYVLVTTVAGLYRYFMNDLVEVTGHYRGTPLLRFVQKGRGVTSLTGEKLYEGQVIDAVQAVLRRRGLAPGFFLFVADEERSCYRLYLEPGGSLAAPHRSAHAATTGDASEPSTASIAWEIDTQLSTVNMEYRGKRESGRLAPLVVARLRPGAGDAYKAACVTAGQREGQFKPALLHYRKQLAFPVESYVQP